MATFLQITFSTALFWLLTFGVAYAHEHAQAPGRGPKWLNAAALASLLTVPVFLFICDAVLLLCPGCGRR